MCEGRGKASLGITPSHFVWPGHRDHLFVPLGRRPAPGPCRYADRAKAIKVKAFKNEEVSLAEKLNEEITMLRMRLMEAVCGCDSS